jgi:hypothetical protein
MVVSFVLYCIEMNVRLYPHDCHTGVSVMRRREDLRSGKILFRRTTENIGIPTFAIPSI